MHCEAIVHTGWKNPPTAGSYDMARQSGIDLPFQLGGLELGAIVQQRLDNSLVFLGLQRAADDHQ